MLKEIILPKQGLQMTEGTITKWIIPEGGDVKEGEPLFEMETDKLTITIDATASGKLLKIVKAEGETVPITEVIAYVGDESDKSAIPAEAAKAAFAVASETSAAAPAAPAPQAVAPEKAPAAPAVAKATQETVSSKKEKTVKATASTPRAKTFAEMYNVNLSKVVPSGPDGLIIARDVVKFAESHSSSSFASYAVIKVNLSNLEKYAEKLGEPYTKQSLLTKIAEKAFAKTETFDCPDSENINIRIFDNLLISVNNSGDMPAITVGAADSDGKSFVSFVYEEGKDEDADKFLGAFCKFAENPVLAFIF